MDPTISKSAPVVKPATGTSTIAARMSLVLGAMFVFLLAALHLIKPDLDPSWSVISEYALGEFGWIMTIAFLSLSASAISLFVAVRPHVKTLSGQIGLFFLLIGAAGPLLAGLFTTDPITTPPDAISTRGFIHSIGAMLSDGILIAATLLTWSLVRRNPDWSSVRAPVILATLVAWVSAIWFTVSMSILLPQNGGQLGPQVLIGWQSRLVVLAYAAWLMTVAWATMRVSTQNSHARA